MTTGEIIFVSEPVFAGVPRVIGQDIYCCHGVVLVITQSDAIYAYTDGAVYGYNKYTNYIVFSRFGVCGTIPCGRMYGMGFDIPIAMCGDLAETLPHAYGDDEWGDSEYETLVDVNESEDFVKLAVYYRHSIIIIRLDIPT